MKKQLNKTTIFFDLFGVLLGSDQSVVIHYISKQVGLTYLKTYEIVLGEAFMRMERGEINFNTYVNVVCSALPKGGCVDKMVVKSMWHDSGVSEMPAVSLLDELHCTNSIWIISNTSEKHIVKLKTKFDFLKHIDGVITSDRAGAYKPYQKIFDFALIEANTKPSFSIFIDDNFANVISAENLGFQAHHYVDFEKLSVFLNNYR